MASSILKFWWSLMQIGGQGHQNLISSLCPNNISTKKWKESKHWFITYYADKKVSHWHQGQLELHQNQYVPLPIIPWPFTELNNLSLNLWNNMKNATCFLQALCWNHNQLTYIEPGVLCLKPLIIETEGANHCPGLLTWAAVSRRN